MKKKRMLLKNRIFVGLLAILLANVAFVPVRAEESDLLELFKTDYEITDVRYDGFYDNKYVSSDGKIEKWYCSYLPEIDGLKRTDEISGIINPGHLKECDIQERHAHLYGDRSEYLKPLYCEYDSVVINGKEYMKTNIITQIDEEAIDILFDWDLLRVSDNVNYLQFNINTARKHGYVGLAHMIPLSITSDSIVLKVVPYYEDTANYNESMNGYLLHLNVSTVTEIFESMPEEKKIITLKKDENGRIVMLQ